MAVYFGMLHKLFLQIWLVSIFTLRFVNRYIGENQDVSIYQCMANAFINPLSFLLTCQYLKGGFLTTVSAFVLLAFRLPGWHLSHLTQPAIVGHLSPINSVFQWLQCPIGILPLRTPHVAPSFLNLVTVYQDLRPIIRDGTTLQT